MRFLIAATAAALIAAPVAAQYRDAPPEVELADRLNDPLLQHGVAASMSAMLGALLDTQVGAFAQFTAPHEDIRPDDTLRDLARRDDPYFEERAYADARRSTELMGRMAGSFAAMMPQLRATADRMRHEFERIDRDYERYDDYGYED
ncbi:hypothetical protein D1610_09035 [Sphingomonas gilva]|uniref:Uncharacterized protein n=1 Tax=Sphingomonas gilva TaxID=2305907 RepID=A0A396RMJ3_9SPHN|nr:hypothetical protein [Sphingomonas gilva]RHW17588.1 hypothetical protein D1610_09035 [Sphingomonas gilva]